jgi:TRAP-type C4-dicarboxylate transport system permease small subunit
MPDAAPHDGDLPIVLQTDRHLKWRSLDAAEHILMVLCGIALGGVCLSVLLDIVTREIGHPWLWLQEATSLSFTYGIFLGAAAATRRNDHLYLSAMTEAMHGQTRRFFEVFNRVAVLACGLAMLIWGVQNVVTGLGNLRMPSMIPLSWWFAAIPLSGAFIALFSVEQIVQGLRNGFARQGPA